MPDVTIAEIKVDSTKVTRVINSIALSRGYKDIVYGANAVPINNPETKAEFVARYFKELTIKFIKQAEGEIAIQSAKTTSDQKVVNEIILK